MPQKCWFKIMHTVFDSFHLFIAFRWFKMASFVVFFLLSNTTTTRWMLSSCDGSFVPWSWSFEECFLVENGMANIQIEILQYKMPLKCSFDGFALPEMWCSCNQNSCIRWTKFLLSMLLISSRIFALMALVYCAMTENVNIEIQS